MQYTDQCLEMSHLRIVPNTLSQSVTFVVEVIVHAQPTEVPPAGGTGLRQGVVSGLRSHVDLSSVGPSRNQVPLPADVFGSSDHDMDLGGDDLVPLEHHLASGHLSSPHPSLDTTQAALGKHLVIHVTLLQVPQWPECVCQAPVIMGPQQSLAGHISKVSRLASDGDRHTMALAASLQEELAALRQRVDKQECLASQHEGDQAEDEDECPPVRCGLRSFRGFITDTWPDYVTQLDPSGHMSCSIAMVLLDLSFEEEHPSCTIVMQVESTLPLSPLLLGVQSFFERHLQGQREEDPIYDLPESLVVFKLSRGDRLEGECGFHLAQPKMFGCNPWSYKVGSHTSSCRLWRIATSPSFWCPPIGPLSHCGRVDGRGAAEDAV